MTPYKREISLLAKDTGCDRAGAPIVRGVSFMLKPGGALQLFGANGSGKTSLLSVFAGHIRLAAGSLLWRANSSEEQDRPFEDSIFFLGHEVSVKPALTAEENLVFWAKLCGAGKNVEADLVHAALERVGMGHCRDMRAGRLSAGQRRRIDLARALLARVDDLTPVTRRANALEYGKMIKHSQRSHLGVEPEFLRQITEQSANRILGPQDVEIVEKDLTGVGFLQRRNRAH